jgi:uncharacterized protein with PIN domain
MRLMGFDVAYFRNPDDRHLLDIMERESRALLTRDRRLLMHAIVRHGFYPRSQNPEEQAVEVIRRFDLSELIAPFTRCLRCNARLASADKAEVMDELEPLTRIYYDQFRRCPDCKQVYWSGSHFPKLQRRIEEIRSHVRGQA